jgi:hypothetical protein
LQEHLLQTLQQEQVLLPQQEDLRNLMFQEDRLRVIEAIHQVLVPLQDHRLVAEVLEAAQDHQVVEEDVSSKLLKRKFKI